MKKHLFRLSSLLALCALVLTAGLHAADAKEKHTFVVVHGATAGGWEWKRCGAFLQQDDHTVYRATLTGHSYGGMVITGVMDRVPERSKHVVFLDAAVPQDGQSLWDIFGGRSPAGPRFAAGFMQVPWVKTGDKPPHSMKQSIKCFNQPVSHKNPAALALNVTYVAFVPKDQSAEARARTDKGWQNAAARGWTIRTFPGGHVAHQEDPRGVATLIAESVNDRYKPVAAK